MVKTTNDILGINPLERIDKLEEIGNEKRNSIASKKKELEEFEKTKKLELDNLEQKKRKELEEFEKNKQKELDNITAKRKELEDLETKKVKEIEETQELIERSFQELMRHKRILLQEENNTQKNKTEEKERELNLEEVANTVTRTNLENNTNYSKFFENLQAPQRLYDITNNQFYSQLTELRNRASRGEITPEEERFVENLKNKFEQFNNDQSYIEKDQNQYVKRSINIVEQIGNYQKLKID